MHRKFDPKVFQLGYVALETADIERTKDHYLGPSGCPRPPRGMTVGLPVDRPQPP